MNADREWAREITHKLMWRVSQSCGIGGHTAMCDEVFAGVKAALATRDAMFARWLESEAAEWTRAYAGPKDRTGHAVAFHRARELEDVARRVRDGSWLADLAALDAAAPAQETPGDKERT